MKIPQNICPINCDDIIDPIRLIFMKFSSYKLGTMPHRYDNIIFVVYGINSIDCRIDVKNATIVAIVNGRIIMYRSSGYKLDTDSSIANVTVSKDNLFSSETSKPDNDNNRFCVVKFHKTGAVDKE